MSIAITVTIDDGIATVTFNRPEQRNAIDYVGWQELRTIAETLGEDDDVKVVVFAGAGDEAFSAGADIKDFELHRNSSAAARTYAEAFDGALDDIEAIPKPTLSLIKGCLRGRRRRARDGHRYPHRRREQPLWHPCGTAGHPGGLPGDAPAGGSRRPRQRVLPAAIGAAHRRPGSPAHRPGQHGGLPKRGRGIRLRAGPGDGRAGAPFTSPPQADSPHRAGKPVAGRAKTPRRSVCPSPTSTAATSGKAAGHSWSAARRGSKGGEV